MNTDEPTKKFNWRMWIWVIAAIVVSPLLVFIAAERSVSRVKIDEGAVVPPPELAKILSRNRDETTSRPLNASDSEAIELCRQFASRADAENAAGKFHTLFKDKLVKGPKPLGDERQYLLPWAGGPMSEAQAQWVHEHADLINLSLRYANAPGRLGTSDQKLIGSQQLMMQLLIADGWVKLHESRRDGIDSYLAIFGLAEKSANPDGIAADPFIYAANRMIQSWIEDPAMPKENAPEVLSRLNRIHQELHSKEKHREQVRALIELEYTKLRKEKIEFINKTPWDSRTFGYDLHYRTEYYWPQIGHTDISLLPRVDRMLVTTFSAMKNKRNSDSFVRTFDKYWEKSLEWPSWPWPEISKKIFGNDFVIGHYYGALETRIILLLTTETMMNLNRAALASMGGAAAPGKQELGVAGAVKDPDNPWRDPFTEKPLMIEGGTTRTLIYSIGPQLIDHKNRVDYWAGERTGGPGNLAISVPKK